MRWILFSILPLFISTTMAQEGKSYKKVFRSQKNNVVRRKGDLIVRSKSRNDHIYVVPDEAISTPKKSRGPLISGDGFRHIAHHVYDELTHRFNPDSIKAGDIVFVSSYFFDDFVENHHHSIMHPYILITHNGHFSMPGIYQNLLQDEKIIAWFSNNLDGYFHPKLYGIPTGIPNLWKTPEDLQEIIIKLYRKPIEKKHLCLLDINPASHNEERKFILNELSHKSFIFHRESATYANYISHLMHSKFVLTPRGKSLDTSRLWEALYTDAYPIVRTSALDPLLKNLPVLIIDDWSEVTEEFLNEQYEIMSNRKYNMEKLDINYWLQQILQVRTDYLNDFEG